MAAGRAAAALIAVAYLLHPAVQVATLGDWVYSIHPDNIAPLCLFSLLYFADVRRARGFWLMSALALLSVESLAPTVAAVGIVIALRGHAWRRHALALSALALAAFLVFTLFGVLGTLFISFTNWDFVSAPSWVGLHNYRELADDPLFWKVLRNTSYYTIAVVPISTALGLLVALGLNRKLPGSVVFRAAYFAPFITTLASAALLWQWIFDPQRGLIDSVLYMVGVSNPPERRLGYRSSVMTTSSGGRRVGRSQARP